MNTVHSAASRVAAAGKSADTPVADRSSRRLAALRIAFGVVWAIDATFKWLPAFSDGFVRYISSGEPGQPAAVKAWLRWWVSLLATDPRLFAHLVAVCETCLAIGLVFGLFSNAVCVVGALLSAGIWSTAEGFGGPYMSGSTDIGTSIIYVFVFAALFYGRASSMWSLDGLLRSRLGPLQILCGRPTAAGSRSPLLDRG